MSEVQFIAEKFGGVRRKHYLCNVKHSCGMREAAGSNTQPFLCPNILRSKNHNGNVWGIGNDPKVQHEWPDSTYCRYSICQTFMETTTNQSEVRASAERLHLSEEEYTTIVDVLKRVDGEGITSFEGEDIFRFATFSFRGFLKELPIVVDILGRHRNESNFDYEDFVMSLKFVAEVITDINEYRFCLMPLSDMCDALYEVRDRQAKEKYLKEKENATA